MRFVLSTTEFDPLVPVEIDALPSSSLGPSARRLNRVATLDGGAAFNDFGYADADRTFSLRWQPVSASHEAAIVRLVQTYARVTVATAEGLYLAAPQTYTPGASESRLDLLVERKLSV